MALHSLNSDDKFAIYRSKLLNETLAVLALAAGINLLFTIHLANKIGWRPYALLQAFAVCAFFTMWLARNKLSYNIKAFGLMSCAYIITFATLANIGPVANSKAGVIVMLLIASVFLDPPYIAIVFIAIALGFFIVSYLAIYKLITFHDIDYGTQLHDPETWINMAIVLIAGGSVVAWIARSMISELIASRTAAEAANRAKSQFIANVSHELRTPLNAILGFTNLLLTQKQNLTKAQCEQLEIIAHSGNSLHRLIDDILDLVRAEAGRFKLQMQSVCLPILLQEIVDTVRSQGENKGLILRIEMAQAFPQQLLLDGERLQQILLNLLDNAIKFTHQGEICLKANCKFIDAAHVDLILTIIDTGPGIPLLDQERIFLPFEQLHSQENKNPHGLGLGLAVCRQLAQLMNGQLTLYSVIDKGSQFSLQLSTVTIIASNADLITPTPLVNYHFHSANVVIADDVEANRALLRLWLSSVGLTCIEAIDGIDAIACIKQTHPALVLLDIKMPRLNGFQVVAQLKANPITADIPVVAITAVFSELAVNQKHGREPFSAWLTKPLAYNDLIGCLAKFLAHEQVVVSQVPMELVTNKLTIDELPSATDLTMLRELTEFRMISEIQDWILANVDSYPQFTRRLNELVRSCDLRMVAEFLDEYAR